jgi:hypothetical protein
MKPTKAFTSSIDIPPFDSVYFDPSPDKDIRKNEADLSIKPLVS